MQTGNIIRIFNHSNNVQVMCSDERGLLSTYFDHGHFSSFYGIIKKAGLNLNGLLIKFDRDTVRIPALSENKEYRSH